MNEFDFRFGGQEDVYDQSWTSFDGDEDFEKDSVLKSTGVDEDDDFDEIDTAVADSLDVFFFDPRAAIEAALHAKNVDPEKEEKISPELFRRQAEFIMKLSGF